jgi:hypothetical protein
MIQQMMQQQAGAGGEVGRPMTKNPVEVAEDRTPGADSNQISAQNESSYKQSGVSK